MSQIIEESLDALARAGNLRMVPADGSADTLVDFTSNDYLGIASRADLRDEFIATLHPEDYQLTASASRLLARRQRCFDEFEHFLENCYGRPALLFNSGYHANTGLVSALAMKDVTVVADKLVHASIIDGIKLAGVPFERFRHNDVGHLERLAAKAQEEGRRVLIIVEGVYSMEGDAAPLEEIIEVKSRLKDALLYVDEAHSVGVEGPGGLGLVSALEPSQREYVDVIIGTLGKALGSVGAYAIMNPTLRSWAVNKARSFIFSTSIPPLNVMWSRFAFEHALGMDAERSHLKKLGTRLGDLLGTNSESHIQGIMTGDPVRAVQYSGKLRELGFDVLPIRTPTVPPGTDRLRVSLSAMHSLDDIERLAAAVKSLNY
ncbi:MAG: 8-amino-7-oxononanoate synthase [Muribaculaceae bacterium]|nr:8-amino-7-oxononanoate synthase [Muribaculaceae bacterium]